MIEQSESKMNLPSKVFNHSIESHKEHFNR